MARVRWTANACGRAAFGCLWFKFGLGVTDRLGGCGSERKCRKFIDGRYPEPVMDGLGLPMKCKQIFFPIK